MLESTIDADQVGDLVGEQLAAELTKLLPGPDVAENPLAVFAVGEREAPPGRRVTRSRGIRHTACP